MHTALILGCGYVGEHLASRCITDGMRVVGTTRSQKRAEALKRSGIEAIVATSPLDIPTSLLRDIDILIDSIPLSRDAGSMHASQPQWLPALSSSLCKLRWAGYLSSSGVYGDAEGNWVDESSPCHPESIRGKERLKAEQTWLASGLPVEIFRLAGIYGPGRNILDKLKQGNYRVVRWSPPHFSSRVHITDIINAIHAAIHAPQPGRIINISDDLPLPHDQYVSELAALTGAPPPTILTAEEAEQQLSPAMLDFFRDNKRISNRKLHEQLLPELRYPSFHHAWKTL